MLLIIQLLLVSATALLFLSLFPINRKLSFLLAVFLSVTAEIILLFEITSLLHTLSMNAILIGELILFVLAILCWGYQDRPNLIAPFRGFQLLKGFKEILGGEKLDWPLLLLFFAVLAITLFSGIATSFTTDGSADTVGYHYPRFALWLQERTIFLPQDVAALMSDLRLVEYPFNSDILYAFFFLGLNNLQSIHLVECLSLFPLMLSIYGIAVQLTGQRRPGLYASLIYALFGVVIRNIWHAEAVLSSTAFFVCGFYFLINALRNSQHHDILFASVGISLALGAKATIYFLIPGLGIIFLIQLLKRENRKQFGLWSVLGLSSLVLFSTAIPVQNLVAFGNVSGKFSEARTTIDDPQTCLQHNLLRYGYELVLPYPLPQAWQDDAAQVYESFGRKLGDLFNAPLESSNCLREPSYPYAIFGIPQRLGANLFFPVLLLGGVILSALGWKREHDFWRPALWVLLISYYLMQSGTVIYTLWKYRYSALPLALFSILFADFYNWIKDRRLFSALLVLTAIMTGTVFAYDQFTENPNEAPGELLLSGSEILIVPAGFNSLDSSFWGSGLSNRLELTSCDQILERLKSGNFDYFIYSWLVPHPSFEVCLEKYADTDGNPLRDLLSDDYELVRESWYRYQAIRLYERRGLSQVDTESNLHSSFYAITVHPSYQDQIGAGPVFINTQTRDNLGETVFSLESLQDDREVSVSIETFGKTCTPDGRIPVSVTNDSAELLSTGRYMPLNRWGDLNELVLTMKLERGINRVSVGESHCEEYLDPPLTINRVIVSPDVYSAGMTLSGSGWYGLEFTPEGQPFRWVDNDAAFTLTVDQGGEYLLTIGTQSGPGHAGENFNLELREEDGAVVAAVEVTGQWAEIAFPLSLTSAGEYSFSLHADGGGLPAGGGDARIMNFLVTGISILPDPLSQ